MRKQFHFLPWFLAPFLAFGEEYEAKDSYSHIVKRESMASPMLSEHAVSRHMIATKFDLSNLEKRYLEEPDRSPLRPRQTFLMTFGEHPDVGPFDLPDDSHNEEEEESGAARIESKEGQCNSLIFTAFKMWMPAHREQDSTRLMCL